MQWRDSGKPSSESISAKLQGPLFSLLIALGGDALLSPRIKGPGSKRRAALRLHEAAHLCGFFGDMEAQKDAWERWRLSLGAGGVWLTVARHESRHHIRPIQLLEIFWGPEHGPFADGGQPGPSWLAFDRTVMGSLPGGARCRQLTLSFSHGMPGAWAPISLRGALLRCLVPFLRIITERANLDQGTALTDSWIAGVGPAMRLWMIRVYILAYDPPGNSVLEFGAEFKESQRAELTAQEMLGFWEGSAWGNDAGPRPAKEAEEANKAWRETSGAQEQEAAIGTAAVKVVVAEVAAAHRAAGLPHSFARILVEVSRIKGMLVGAIWACIMLYNRVTAPPP